MDHYCKNDTYQIAVNIYLMIDHNRKDKQNLLSTPEKRNYTYYSVYKIVKASAVSHFHANCFCSSSRILVFLLSPFSSLHT